MPVRNLLHQFKLAAVHCPILAGFRLSVFDLYGLQSWYKLLYMEYLINNVLHSDMHMKNNIKQVVGIYFNVIVYIYIYIYIYITHFNIPSDELQCAS